MCLSFQKGECKFGDSCKYRHVLPADAARPEVVDESLQIAACFRGCAAQEQVLKRIMALPEALRGRARAIFFAKQRSGTLGRVFSKKPAEPSAGE